MQIEKLTVLVVEDEVLIRMGIVDALEDAGFLVFQAGDADQAVAALIANASIQLMFTDIDMPGGMDGLKLAKAVRDGWPRVKIVVTSGAVMISKRDLPVEGEFFGKPYNSERVIAAMRGLLQAA